MNKVTVVAAIITRDNKFLLGKRALNKKSGAGYWCQPRFYRTRRATGLELGRSEELLRLLTVLQCRGVSRMTTISYVVISYEVLFVASICKVTTIIDIKFQLYIVTI